MDRLYSYFVDEALFAILTVTGIVVSVVLFVLLCRNRKQDQLTRRRFLLLSVLTPVHTVLLPLVFLLETKSWRFSGFSSFLSFSSCRYSI